MRLILGLFYLLGLGSQLLAQDTTSLVNLHQGLSLDEQEWRFQAGHDPNWARADYHDQQWRRQKLTIIFSQNQRLQQARQGWFRLAFRIPKRLKSQPLQLLVNQFGSSQWYLDGQQLANLVPDSTKLWTSQRVSQLISFTLSDTNRHVLAVHYIFRPEPVVYAATTSGGFRVWVDTPSRMGDYLINTYRLGSGLRFCLAAVFALLGLLHLLVYQANRAQLLNGWLAATMSALAVFFLFLNLRDFAPTHFIDSVFNLISVLGGHLGYGLLLTAVYRYVNRPLGGPYWVAIGLLVASLLYRVGVGPMPGGFNGLLLVLVFLDYIRVSWLGKQQANVDARLPWVSLRISLYALLTCLVLLIGVIVLMVWLAKEPNVNPLIAVLIFPSLVALLSVPLGLSYSLVRDYTRTHQALRTNLRLIEELSAQTLLQEQEKQLLLSQQNLTLERRVQQRTAELKLSLDELRMTQAQLIQREKLASLGELTAGIAHEIQNPLNFVTNFSEVSSELIQELMEENHKPQPDRAVVFDLAGDLTLNLQKITQHGIRASSIVKGMLEHSRSSTGTIESTNLNALVEEYLRLAYQGQRAKDKGFDCELVTDFDPAIGSVSLMTQEIGRVLLNLFNNAYYAIKERKQQDEPDYQPTIRVSTLKTRNGVEVWVSDNGTGMSEVVQEKIFQPFFTTKPSGEGTGLGLSLSYDIVTKGHGGLLRVESQVGVGSVFTIQLPQADPLNSYA